MSGSDKELTWHDDMQIGSSGEVNSFGDGVTKFNSSESRKEDDDVGGNTLQGLVDLGGDSGDRSRFSEDWGAEISDLNESISVEQGVGTVKVENAAVAGHDASDMGTNDSLMESVEEVATVRDGKTCVEENVSRSMNVMESEGVVALEELVDVSVQKSVPEEKNLSVKGVGGSTDQFTDVGDNAGDESHGSMSPDDEDTMAEDRDHAEAYCGFSNDLELEVLLKHRGLEIISPEGGDLGEQFGEDTDELVQDVTAYNQEVVMEEAELNDHQELQSAVTGVDSDHHVQRNDAYQEYNCSDRENMLLQDNSTENEVREGHKNYTWALNEAENSANMDTSDPVRKLGKVARKHHVERIKQVGHKQSAVKNHSGHKRKGSHDFDNKEIREVEPVFHSLKKFQLGDMVWGKVKSHPWWPGHIYSEAFASTSVRRSKRPGHVLVAFFGDSSYGWFDPAELIPFEPNYEEKSTQTNSRNFMVAVSEAVDEMKRRYALGLACSCRNDKTFRPLATEGYFAVDVPGYEGGGVYSEKQIQESRDRIRPAEFLSFVKELALDPQSNMTETFDGLKSVAAVFAYRNAVFEEFDPTFLEAFGVEPVRAPPEVSVPRAPLSGRLVIAETLSGNKSSKPAKTRSSPANKDKYLFKKRDMPLHQGPAAKDLAVKEFSSCPTRDTDHKKRKHVRKEKKVPTTEMKATVSSGSISPIDSGMQVVGVPGGKQNSLVSPYMAQSAKMGRQTVKPDTTSIDETNHVSNGMRKVADGRWYEIESVQAFDIENVVPIEEGDQLEDDYEEPGTPVFQGSVAVADDAETKTLVFSADTVSQEGIRRTAERFTEGHGFVGGVPQTTVDAKGSLKRQSTSMSDGTSTVEVGDGVLTKKKKRKKNAERANDQQPRDSDIQKSVKMDSGKMTKSVTDMQAKQDLQNKGGNIVDDIDVRRKSGLGDSNQQILLRQLISDLSCLALDPFYGRERNVPVTVKRGFLMYRSLVYQKSLRLSSLEAIPRGNNLESQKISSLRQFPGKQDQGSGGREMMPGSTELKARQSQAGGISKQQFSKPSESSKDSRKRHLMERSDDVSGKKMKTVHDAKPLKDSVRRPAQVTSEGRKDPDSAAPRQAREEINQRQLSPPPREKPELTGINMKFPFGAMLPTESELKARFARFGPLDVRGIRSYLRSATCRVVFKYKSDAKTALDFVKRSSPFGPGIIYTLRDMNPQPEPMDLSSRHAEDTTGSGGATYEEVPVPPLYRTGMDGNKGKPGLLPLPQRAAPPAQLKSILKKPATEETSGNGGGTRESQRVKFALGFEDRSRSEYPINSSYSADTATTPVVGMDFNNMNNKVFSHQPPPPSLPIHAAPSTHLTSAPPLPVLREGVRDYYQGNQVVVQAGPSGTVGQSSSGAAVKGRGEVDISVPFMNLLLKCKEIVGNIQTQLGYMPYHPL